MSNQTAATAITRAERIDLARSANVQIRGLSDQLLHMVREQNIDSDATGHHAALGMLAMISELSDDVFNLVFGDQSDEITRDEARDIVRRLGIERIDAST
jgi:hypothetical protein